MFFLYSSSRTWFGINPAAALLYMKSILIIAALMVASQAIQIKADEGRDVFTDLLNSFQKFMDVPEFAVPREDISAVQPISQVMGVADRHDIVEKCLGMLEDLNKDAIEIARMMVMERWRDSIPVIIEFSVKMYDTVMCFMDANKESKTLGEDVGNDWWRCVKNHMCKAWQHMMAAIKHLMRMHWQAFRDEMNIVCKILKDIKNCN